MKHVLITIFTFHVIILFSFTNLSYSQNTYYTATDIDSITYTVYSGKLLVLKRDAQKYLNMVSQQSISDLDYISSAISSNNLLIATIDTVFIFSIIDLFDPVFIAKKYIGNIARVEPFGNSFIVIKRNASVQEVIAINADSVETLSYFDRECYVYSSLGRMCFGLTFSYPYVLFNDWSEQLVEMWKYDENSHIFSLLHSRNYASWPDWEMTQLASTNNYLFVLNFKEGYPNYDVAIRKLSIQSDSLVYVSSINWFPPAPLIDDWEISEKYHRFIYLIFPFNTTNYNFGNELNANINLNTLPLPIISDYHTYKTDSHFYYTYKTTSDSILFREFDYLTDIREISNTNIEYYLSQNYPNPFNPSTKIQYSIPSNVKGEMSNVSLKVYDVLGNEVITLVNEEKPAGEYEVEFTISNLQITSGIYFYQLIAGTFLETKKLVVLK